MTIHTPAQKTPKAPAHDHPPELIPLGGGEWVLVLRRGKRVVHVTHYRLDRLTSAWGVAYRLRKLGGDGALLETYAVIFDGPSASCDCPGGSYCGKCRHATALAALRGEGKLP